jgi:hypothetical protein
MFFVFKKESFDKFHSDRVESGHNDFVVLSFAINYEWFNGVSPVDPFLFGSIEFVIIASSRCREFEFVFFAHDFSKFVIEFDSTIKICSATNGPYNRENKNAFDYLFKLFNFVGGDFLELCVKVWLEEAIKHSEE